MKNKTLLRSLLSVVGALALSVSLAACSAASDDVDSGDSEVVENVTELTLSDGWAKATDSMTGVFGTLHNPGSEDIALVDAASSVATLVELHETVVSSGNMTMQEIDDGFMIPAGGSYELEPGGDHIMLMGLERELLPGEQLDLQLVFSNGEEVDLLIDIRDFAGAIEEYAPGDHDEHHQHHGNHENHHEHHE